jgi:hypothetical protein
VGAPDDGGTVPKTRDAPESTVNCDLLLEWMTHTGSGAWGAFRDAACELSQVDDVDEAHALFRNLRIAFSDLGHVDFFIDGSRRWRVLRPALVGLTASDEHILVGGRTRSLVEKLSAAVQRLGARMSVTEEAPGLSRICVAGGPAAVRRCAAETGTEYVPAASAFLASRLSSLRHMIDTAPEVPEPINWTVRSWSFADENWVADRLPRTVREYSNRYGARRYMLHLGRSGLRELDKREATYGAALVSGIQLARYSRERGRLRVPRWAPLPDAYARAASLGGGQLAIALGAELVFESVDPVVGSMLLISLGQGFPMPGALP